MNVLDPHLRLRLAEWLAYHLSNYEYVWPWAKWAHVLAAPPYDGQR
jgi:nuclear cap-binding protein subunit 1